MLESSRIHTAPVDGQNVDDTPKKPIDLARIQSGLSLSAAITRLLEGRAQLSHVLQHQSGVVDSTSSSVASPAGATLLQLLRDPQS